MHAALAVASDRRQLILLGESVSTDNATLILRNIRRRSSSVLAPSKRRASFYTLPVVVVIGFLLVAGLAAWQRADVVADLADRIAHGDSAEATSAVRQLAAMPSAPLTILVDAATSDEHATAEAVQVAINRMLGRWQRDLEKKRRVSAIAAELTKLAAELAEQRREFPTADYPWLAGTTRKILRLANKCPAEKTPLVAMHCDAIMSVIGAGDSRTTPIAGRDQPVSEESNMANDAAAVPAADADNRESRQARLDRDFSAFPSQSVVAGSEISTESPEATSEVSLMPASNADQWDTGDSPTMGERDRGDWQRDAAQSGRGALPGDRSSRPDWSLPIFRILPAMPMTTKADDNAEAKLDDGSSRSAVPSLRIAASETRALLGRWRSASGNELQFVEHDLATRGFKHLPKRLVEQYLSDELEDRLQLFDGVLTEPGVDARPWLLLLADDENAEVRLLAVTVMATSDDKSLVERAWQVAIRDRDPRIADLAGRLRDRRTGAQRR